jgi:hypothetical protein
MIVSFPQLAEIEDGDTITVYECGATEELFNASVGVGTDVNGSWVRVITSGTGEVTGTVDLN